MSCDRAHKNFTPTVAHTESSEASTNIYSNVEQKNVTKILKESHEDRIRQITAFQQGNVIFGNLDVD